MNTTDERDTVPCDKQRLLIVDDEKTIRGLFSELLSYRLPNCRIDVAVNGAEAVEIFRTIHHGLVLMDLKMPVMNGETAFYRIQEICEKEGWEMPAVIFWTGYTASSSIEKIVANSRVHCLLYKPVTGDVLLQVLKSRLPDQG